MTKFRIVLIFVCYSLLVFGQSYNPEVETPEGLPEWSLAPLICAPQEQVRSCLGSGELKQKSANTLTKSEADCLSRVANNASPYACAEFIRAVVVQYGKLERSKVQANSESPPSKRNIDVVLNNLLYRYGVFKFGSPNYYIPPLAEFEKDKKIRLMEPYRSAFEEYRKSRNPDTVGVMVTSLKRPLTDLRITFDGQAEAFYCAGEKEAKSCFSTVTNDHRAFETMIQQQVDCINSLATKIQDSNPLCAGRLRTEIAKYNGAMKPMQAPKISAFGQPLRRALK